MKTRNLIIPVVVVATLGLGACKSEIDNKTAAEVSEAAATETMAAEAAPAGESIGVIKDVSKISFVGSKVTLDHDGGFNDFDGNVMFVEGKPSAINFTIDLNSLWTDAEKLTGHLKSPDFFDVATFPTATFTSTGITEAEAGNPDDATHMISGNLDLHGVTKSVTFPATVMTTPDGITATSQFTINRHDWGISYPGKPDDLIKDLVLIKLDLRFPSAPAAEMAAAAPAEGEAQPTE
jgi:polyisoprenoid-binding protein YceI